MGVSSKLGIGALAICLCLSMGVAVAAPAAAGGPAEEVEEATDRPICVDVSPSRPGVSVDLDCDGEKVIKI